MSESNTSSNEANASNNQFYNSMSALSIRLDVEPILRIVELDIRGLKERVNVHSGVVELVRVCDPMFRREEGIHFFISFIRTIFNTQIVQGYLDEDTYADYMCSVHRRLASDLMTNRNIYGLDINHYEGVIALAMNLFRGFLTRPINNKERESYANTFKHVESSNTVARGGGGLFGFGSKN